MLASLSKNTLLQYNVSLKLWWNYCQENCFNFYAGSSPAVLSFLTDQFKNGASYGSLNNHRSALSLLLGSNISSDDQVKRLMKGAYKLRPTIPKYTSTWDPQTVLNHISTWVPNKDLTIEKITKKLVILLALCTAHRVQTLSLIKLKNVHTYAAGIKIIISDIIKTSAVGREQPVLFLPYFNENQNICPATVIQDYLEVTNKIRTDSLQNLLLTFKRPYRNATAQTISRWIKQVLGDSGVDVTAFSAHSARHAATSAAKRAGVSLEVIRKAAGWSKTSETFARYYNRPLADEGNFARAICITDQELSDC
jgi:site-specific recombinase XerD